MEQIDLRREKLNAWWKATGRTPMKRKSYVQEYYKPSPQSKLTEATGIHVHPIIQRPLSCKRLAKESGSKSCRRPAGTCVRQVKDIVQRENVSPQVPQKLNFQHSNKKLSRREMLDQWLAIHGSTLKRPRSVLRPLNQPRAQTEIKKRLLSSQQLLPHSPCTMRKLKEQFQREIDEDCLEDEEHGAVDNECALARELDFNESGDYSTSETPTAAHKIKTRYSLAHDSTLIFRSSTIRYSLAQSEPRKRRHKRRHTTAFDGSNKHLIYLTPVRRSTRKNKHTTLTDICVDSPGQLLGREGFSDAMVEIVPNKALDFDQL